jgi:hypothetical protein
MPLKSTGAATTWSASAGSFRSQTLARSLRTVPRPARVQNGYMAGRNARPVRAVESINFQGNGPARTRGFDASPLLAFHSFRAAISAPGSACDPRSRRSIAPDRATREADFQGLYGSDGTRTRDLRRDRHVPRKRRLATIDAQSLYSCDAAGFWRLICAQMNRLDFECLLPFCCPSATRLTRGTGSTSSAAEQGPHWRTRSRHTATPASAHDRSRAVRELSGHGRSSVLVWSGCASASHLGRAGHAG